MRSLPEFVGTIHIFFGPYRGNPIGLYLRKEGDSCSISPTVYPWNRFVGVGETANKAAADFDVKWKEGDLTTEMYSGPHWEGGIKPEKPKPPPKPPAAAKPEATKPETPRTESPQATTPAETNPTTPAPVVSPKAEETSASSASAPNPSISPSQSVPSGPEGPAPSASQEATRSPVLDDSPSAASADPRQGPASP